MSKLARNATCFVATIALTLLCSASFATDYYVSTTTGSDTGGNGSQASPWGSIQYAIVLATGTSTNPANIRVAAGVYNENLLIMESYMNLWGGYEPTTWTRDIAANETIIDGGGVDSCVRFGSAVAAVLGGAIDGFIIRNGQAANGGGIYCYASSPRIANNIISGNSAIGSASDPDDGGGGIFCQNNSSPTIRNNIIIENSSEDWGGGIYCRYNSSPIIENNIICGNSAIFDGGGIGLHNSSPTIQNNIISGNLAVQYDGGGITCYGSFSPLIQNNIISGNSGRYAGGILCLANSSPTIQNNTISSNKAGVGGGGICCFDSSSPLMKNNSFYENNSYDVFEVQAASDAQAYYNEFYGNTSGIWYDEGTISLATIVQVNALAEADFNISVLPEFLPSLTGVSSDISYNPSTFQSTLTDTSAAFPPGALARLLLNPDTTQSLQFPIVSNTATTITVWGDITGVATIGDPYRMFDYHLAPGSSLINAGTLIAGVTGDIDGDVRPYPSGGKFDIGADEYTGPLPGEGEGEPLIEPEPDPGEGEEEISVEVEPEAEEGEIELPPNAGYQLTLFPFQASATITGEEFEPNNAPDGPGVWLLNFVSASDAAYQFLGSLNAATDLFDFCHVTTDFPLVITQPKVAAVVDSFDAEITATLWRLLPGAKRIVPAGEQQTMLSQPRDDFYAVVPLIPIAQRIVPAGQQRTMLIPPRGDFYIVLRPSGGAGGEGEGEFAFELEFEPSEGEGEEPPPPIEDAGGDEALPEPEPEPGEGEGEGELEGEREGEGEEAEFEEMELEEGEPEGEGEEMEEFEEFEAEGEEIEGEEFEGEELEFEEGEEFEAPELEIEGEQPQLPLMNVIPLVLSLTSENPSSTFFVKNVGGGTLAWRAQSNNLNILVNPTSGQLASGIGEYVSVSAAVIVANFQAVVTVTNASNPSDARVQVQVNVTADRPTGGGGPLISVPGLTLCPISTSAASAPLAREIDNLRAFRDDGLLANALGRHLTGFYYKTSSVVSRVLR